MWNIVSQSIGRFDSCDSHFRGKGKLRKDILIIYLQSEWERLYGHSGTSRGRSCCKGGKKMQDIDVLKASLIEKAGQMAIALAKGKDLEVRRTRTGVTVAEVTKKVQK